MEKETDASKLMDCSYALGADNAIWGHPVVYAWVENCPVKVTLDSGSTQSLVQADIITSWRNRKASPVRVASKLRQWVQLQLMEHQGELLVGVVPRLV